jgi:hypothetical protein
VTGTGETKHIGMAIIVDPHHVMTCCHVVNLALGREDFHGEAPKPDERIAIQFPYGDDETWVGHVVKWCLDPENLDVAVLQLDAAAPVDAGVASFVDGDARKLSWSCIGYNAKGVVREAPGTLGVVLPGGVQQLNGPQGVAVRIERGYSGAAVWCDEAGARVGMVVTKDWDQELNGASYAVVAAELQRAWPNLSIEPWNRDAKPRAKRELAAGVRFAIQQQFSICEQRDLKFRSPHLMAALLGMQPSFTSTCLTAVDSQFTARLRGMIDSYLAAQRQSVEERGYLPLGLETHPILQQAFTIAEQEGASTVDERHVLLGFLHSQSKLNDRIRRDLGDHDYARFRDAAANKRPGWAEIGATPESLLDARFDDNGRTD